MKKIDEIMNSIKNLEEGIQKVMFFVESSIDTLRQEIAFINQKVSELESRIDRMDFWPQMVELTGEENVGEAASGKACTDEPRVGGVTLQGYREMAVEPAPTLRRVPQFEERPKSAREAGGGRGGGIVEEQFVKPSAFLRKLSEIETLTPSSQSHLPPQSSLRLQISSVLENMRSDRIPVTPRERRQVAPVAPESHGYLESPRTQQSEAKTFRVPENWLPDCSRAKYYNPKSLDKGILRDMEKKTKDIFVR
ncbi:MAG: hypothetical protein QW461_09685 [Candidatus Jordarchaeales archaeon]